MSAAAVLKRNQDRRVRAGHPWIFSNEIAEFDGAVEDGGVVDILDARRAFLGRGFLNRHSLIAIRMLTRRDEPISLDLFRRRFERAIAYRDLVAAGETARRLVAGEADQLPGLFVDRYGDWLVVQSTTLGMDLRLTEIAEPLREATGAKGAFARCDQPARALEGLPPRVETLWGEVPDEIVVDEDGLDFEVRPRTGQKTGLYLDQRDNRRRMRRHLSPMREPRVLDVFCYVGAWALAALEQGAASVVGVDSSAPALDQARRNAERNGLAARAHFVEADAFEELRRLERGRERFDVVICDPPSLVRSRAHQAAGLRAYRELNIRALRLLTPGGLLATATCSHNVTRELFLGALAEAQRDARRHCKLLEVGGQSLDHPVLLAAPETSYLTTAFLRVM